KLAVIQRAVIALGPLGDLPFAVYQADLIKRKAAERLLQEAVEAAIDIGTHTLVREGRPVPADLFSTFAALAALGAIDVGLAAELAPAAGLRHRLVHEYDEIDDAIVHAAIPKAVGLFPRF